MKIRKKLKMEFIVYSIIIFLFSLILALGICLMNNQTSILEYIKLFCIIFLPLFVVIEVLLLMAYAIPMIILLPIRIIVEKTQHHIEDTDGTIYNRDLPKYNSAIAGYLVDGYISGREEYLALYLELIIKGVIKRDFFGNKLAEDLTTHTNGAPLTRAEKYVLETYQNFYGVMNSSFSEFRIDLEMDAIDLELMYPRNQYWEKFKHHNNIKDFSTGMITIFVVAVFLFGAFLSTIINPDLAVLIFLVTVMIGPFIIAYTGKYTKQGKLEKEKLEKLYRFLKNETSLKNKELNERNFDDFMPYAIALDINNIYEDKILDILLKLK